MLTVHKMFGAIAAAFGSGSGTVRRPSPVQNRARLSLEPLDPRLSPSGLPGTSDPEDVTLLLAASVVQGATAGAPQVKNFGAAQIVGGYYRLEGDVIDAAPAGLTVTFGGDPDSLQGVTTTTDANGHFIKLIDFKLDGSDNGTATAQTVNTAGVESNIAMILVHPA